MAYNTFRMADGYALNPTDGYSFTSAWIDLHSSPWFSITVTFVGGTPAGTLKLQQSNDKITTASNGGFPVSAGSPFGDPTDVADVPSGTGNNTFTISAAGSSVFNQYNVGYRWVRLVFTASSNVITTLNAYMHFKSAT